MNLQENGVLNSAILTCQVFHRMVCFKAEMNVPIHAFIRICLLAPLVATGSRNRNPLLLKPSGRAQPVRPNQGEISAIGEMVESRDAMLSKGISLCHGLSPLRLSH